MRLAIIGGRDFTDYNRLMLAIEDFFPDSGGVSRISEVVSGAAKGADSLGARYARECGLKLTEHLPNWDLYGKRAGFIRNELIIKDADMVLAFWDGLSKGTGNSLSIAKRLKKTTLIVYF